MVLSRVRRRRQIGMILACLCVLGSVTAWWWNAGRVDRLISDLKSGKDRDAAVLYLGEEKDPRAVGPLMAVLYDDDYPNSQGSAAYALGKIGAPAVEALIAALNDPNSRSVVRYCAAEALGQTKDHRAVTPLIAALRDRDSRVRTSAAKALGEFKDPRAAEALKELEDLDRALLSEQGSPSAVEALKELKHSNAVLSLVNYLIPTTKDRTDQVRNRAIAMLRTTGAPAVEPLIASLNDSDPRVRHGAAEVLGEIKDPRVVSALLSALAKRNLEAVAGASDFFLRSGPPESFDVLLQALETLDDRGVAGHLLNSGNSKLEAAARKWLTVHGVRVITQQEFFQEGFDRKQ